MTVEKKVIAIGTGPSVYMAGIYLHTGNIKTTIIKPSSEIEGFRGVDKVGGVLNCHTPKDFTELVESQAKNLGINVIKTDIKSISYENTFLVKTDYMLYTCNALVIEDSNSIQSSIYDKLHLEDGFFDISLMAPNNEAIVLSAAGCKTAFSVKEYLDSLN